MTQKQRYKREEIFVDGYHCKLDRLTCHSLPHWKPAAHIQKKKKVWQLLCLWKCQSPDTTDDDLLFFFMIIESATASPDVITLFCLCWHVEEWNIVIEMHYHPSLNWDQSQAGLCKWTLIWESVCPGQRASSAKKSWLGSSQSEPRVSGSSSGEHVLVSMLELLCIFAPDSLHHPFGNHGGNWGICQRRDKKGVINSSWRKLFFPYCSTNSV